MNKVSEAFFEADIRAEQVINLSMVVGHWDQALPDAFNDFFDDYIAGAVPDDGDLKELIQTLPSIAEIFQDAEFECWGTGDLARWFCEHGHFGQLIQLATPVRFDFSEDGACFCTSWGHYHTTWIYADNDQAAVAAALAWKDAMAEADKAAAQSKPATAYAYCFAGGVVEFGPELPDGALPIAHGPEAILRAWMDVKCRHAHDGETLLVPGIPEARNQIQAVDALTAFKEWIKPSCEQTGLTV
jgi:hypothetical protein